MLTHACARPPARAHAPTRAHTRSLSRARSQLFADARRCVRTDGVSAPACDRLRRLAGHAHEQALYAALRAAHVPFSTEEELRARGCARTPDAHLDVPLLVDGRVVHWIDSKVRACVACVLVRARARAWTPRASSFAP